MKKTINQTVGSLLINILQAGTGVIFLGFSVYLLIQANIGVSPWDTFILGLTNVFDISYGEGFFVVSASLLLIDLLMHEPIGISMVMYSFMMGRIVDFFDCINLVPQQQKLMSGILLMIFGLIIAGFSQVLYMRAALGCGPRDTFIVGLSRRFPRISIGTISVIENVVVTVIGWRLGGPIGIGTLICAVLTGPIMELDFRLVHFDATKVRHQNITASVAVLLKTKM